MIVNIWSDRAALYAKNDRKNFIYKFWNQGRCWINKRNSKLYLRSFQRPNSMMFFVFCSTHDGCVRTVLRFLGNFLTEEGSVQNLTPK